MVSLARYHSLYVGWRVHISTLQSVCHLVDLGSVATHRMRHLKGVGA